METTLIIREQHWKPKRHLVPLTPWMLSILSVVSLQGWPLERRCPYSCTRSNILALSLISPRPNPTKTVQKLVPFLLGLPHVPKNESTIQSSSKSKFVSIHQSVPCSGRSFDPQMILQTEEKWSILFQNKRRHFSERSMKEKEINLSWPLFVLRNGSKYFIILIWAHFIALLLTPTPILTLINTDSQYW